MSNDILSARDKAELLKLIDESGGLEQAVDIEHKTSLAPPDQVIMMTVKQMYLEAPKHPETGELFRPHAAQIKGYLNRLTDDGLVQRYKSIAHFHGQPVNAPYPFFARLMHILINEKGLWAKVSE